MDGKQYISANTGIGIIEHDFVPSGKFMHDPTRNIMYVPSDGSYYTILFINGVSDDMVRGAIDYAKSKINRIIQIK